MPDSDIRLVINADDFGLSPAISRGILRAHREGVVTSTSLLGNVADLAGARALLSEAPGLGVGVHLALTGGGPVAPPDRVRSLLAGAGADTFHARGHDFITAWARGRIAPEDVERELDAQVGRIRDAGIAVDHLDTHHHLGFLPVVGRAVETVARRHGIAGIRSAVERPTLAWVTEPRRGLEASLLTGLAWVTRRQLGARRHGPQSWGYVESGHLDEIRILEIIGRLSTGPHELICHPGEDDADRVEESGRYQRLLELGALTSEKVRRALGQRAITLCRWGDLL
ncbi:MAG TPA: ChbG/HpnK family deacetylase [Polyangia bacterium]|nr:ChbG/HpnK family deacetylase [Polyangia bacterium]